jgi:hypothetical protein
MRASFITSDPIEKVELGEVFIETFLPDFENEVVLIEYGFENSEDGRDVEIPFQKFINWIESDYPELIAQYQYYNLEYSEKCLNWLDLLRDGISKSMEIDFLNVVLK